MIAADCVCARNYKSHEIRKQGPDWLNIIRSLAYSNSFSGELESLLWHVWLIDMHIVFASKMLGTDNFDIVDKTPSTFEGSWLKCVSSMLSTELKESQTVPQSRFICPVFDISVISYLQITKQISREVNQTTLYQILSWTTSGVTSFGKTILNSSV